MEVFRRILAPIAQSFLPQLFKSGVESVKQRFQGGELDEEFLLMIADLLEEGARELRSLAGQTLMDEIKRKARRVEVKDRD
ncbi:MAG: hypothetical protein ACE5Z5_08050 [Candidatus Bathyarchaeia archaeon]